MINNDKEQTNDLSKNTTTIILDKDDVYELNKDKLDFMVAETMKGCHKTPYELKKIKRQKIKLSIIITAVILTLFSFLLLLTWIILFRKG